MKGLDKFYFMFVHQICRLCIKIKDLDVDNLKGYIIAYIYAYMLISVYI